MQRLPASAAKVTVRVKVQYGHDTVEVTTTAPLHLSGDRRRWKRQLREHFEERTALLTVQFAEQLHVPEVRT